MGGMTAVEPQKDHARAAHPTILTGEMPDRLLGLVRSSSGETLTTYAPYTGAEIARLPQCAVVDVEAAFARARSAQRACVPSRAGRVPAVDC